MPNMIITASPKAADHIRLRLPDLDRFLRTVLHAKAVNLLVVEATAGPTSADVYVELLYRGTPERPPEVISRFGNDFCDALDLEQDESYAFRAFAVTSDDVVSVNIP
jgi:hypothetical protein